MGPHNIKNTPRINPYINTQVNDVFVILNIGMNKLLKMQYTRIPLILLQ